MRRGIKLFKSLTLSLALVLGLAGAPAGATEFQNDVSATSSDAVSETMTKPCGDVTFHAIEGTPVHIDGGVSLDDAVSVEVAARDYDQYRNQYVYENLDYYEQRFYDGLEDMAKQYINTNVDSTLCLYADWAGKDLWFMDGVSYEGLSRKRAEDLYMIFAFQNPQYYFMANYIAVYEYDTLLCPGIYDDFIYGTTRANCTERFFNKVDSVVNRVKGYGGDYALAKAAHDEVCNLVTYEHNNYDQTAWSTFMLGKTVCSGYSKAYTMVANACNIETCCDISNVPNYEHAWNRAYVDGNWYYVDCTWDDDYYEYNSIAYEFFLIGKDTLSYLDWSPAHDTQESLWGLLPECPIDYSPSNPPSGDEPPAKKLSSAGIFILQSDRNGVLAGLTTNLGDNSNLEYSWYATNDNGNSWALLKDWTQADEWLAWTPPIYGDYIIVGKVREKGSSEVFSDATNISYHPHIKGKCQMPYAGGGYLIGVESYENPNQSYKYEMMVLDCTLLAAGKDAWIYTTGKCGVSTGNALWTVWQPQYGYYWTLFRVYDENDVLLDEACYGFVNAY